MTAKPNLRVIEGREAADMIDVLTEMIERVRAGEVQYILLGAFGEADGSATVEQAWANDVPYLSARAFLLAESLREHALRLCDD